MRAMTMSRRRSVAKKVKPATQYILINTHTHTEYSHSVFIFHLKIHLSCVDTINNSSLNKVPYPRKLFVVDLFDELSPHFFSIICSFLFYLFSLFFFIIINMMKEKKVLKKLQKMDRGHHVVSTKHHRVVVNSSAAKTAQYKVSSSKFDSVISLVTIKENAGNRFLL